MKVVAIDPGETTGYAVVEWDTSSAKIPLKAPKNSFKVSTGELEGYSNIKALISKENPDKVIYEGFKLYPWKAKNKIWSNFPTVEVIGVIKYLMETYFPDIELVEQLPKDKKFYDNPKLKKLGIYDDRSAHERDGLRHAFYYLTMLYKKEG